MATRVLSEGTRPALAPGKESDMSIDSQDFAEVAALVAKYNRAFDFDDVEEWVDTFTVDGAFLSKDGTAASGHDGLREWFKTRDHVTLHVTTDPTLEEDSDGIVHHRCTVLVFRRQGDAYFLGSVGEYRDTVEKTGKGWRFSSRAPTTHRVVSGIS